MERVLCGLHDLFGSAMGLLSNDGGRELDERISCNDPELVVRPRAQTSRTTQINGHLVRISCILFADNNASAFHT